MHEVAIASELLEQVLEIAQANNAVIVESVDVVCGEQRLVVLEALVMAWKGVSQNTIAASATLNLSEKPMKGRCRLCMNEFCPSIDDYRCTQCGEADVEIFEGNDIVLSTMVCHSKDEIDEE